MSSSNRPSYRFVREEQMPSQTPPEAGDLRARREAGESWVPARFYVAEGARLRCTLCPHACSLADGEVGVCRVRRRTGGQLETAAFAAAVRHWDPVERKPFYHFRPGTVALTLAAPGCSFRCTYCQNYRISQYGRIDGAPIRAEPVDPAATVAAAAARRSSIALSYSEPILAAEMTLELAGATRGLDVPLLWKSNGFITPEALAEIGPRLAAVNIDVKAADEKSHMALAGAPLTPVLEAIEGFLRMGVWVEVSTPVIPGFNSDRASLRRIAGIVRDLGRGIPWHLLRFHPEFRMASRNPTSPAMLAEARAIGLASGLVYVYVERAHGPEGRDTRCPGCGAVVIRRGIWSLEAASLVDGSCGRCGLALPGRWESVTATEELTSWPNTSSSTTCRT
jgi:pyruvate formate lyase activating enzyme